jgi:hypothetical protein
MIIKPTIAAMAVIANAACLFWPPSTAPSTASGPRFCVAISRHGHCAAPPNCACIAFEGNRRCLGGRIRRALRP